MRLILTSALGAVLGLTVLAACSQSLGADMAAPVAAAPAACAAESYQVLVGQPAGEVDTASLPQPVRVVSAGEAMSGAPSPGRMTIVSADDGRVGQVICS